MFFNPESVNKILIPNKKITQIAKQKQNEHEGRIDVTHYINDWYSIFFKKY